jgi:hypothetical protein
MLNSKYINNIIIPPNVFTLIENILILIKAHHYYLSKTTFSYFLIVPILTYNFM